MSYTVQFNYQGASVDLHVWDEGENTATVSTVFSKFKKRGAGRKVLDKAIEYADLLSLDLVLEVSPFGEGPKMADHELRAFYMSLGFRLVGDNVMERTVKREPNEAKLMVIRPWGEATTCTYTEEEAVRIIDVHGLSKVHFFFAE